MCIFSWAATPTVTVTKSSETKDNTVVYRFSFTTSIATLDTAVLYKTISTKTPWYVGYLASKNVPDSVITLHLETTETTLDSCRKKVLFQISYQDSPNTTQLQHDHWYTFQSTTLDSSISDIVAFIPNRVGVPYKLRVLVIETDANKDATQTFSGELCFPKFASL
jgi:hypothetical protein